MFYGRICVNDVHLLVCVQGPSPPSHETSHILREKDFRDYRQDRRHARDRDADRSHVRSFLWYTDQHFVVLLTDANNNIA